MNRTNIYVLRLEGGRYYVGKSDDINKRFQQHVNGTGSAWTKKYKPIKIEKRHENVSPFEEDKVTLEYMSKYGIDKVRGGSFIDVELSDFHIESVKNQIWAAKDLCTQCGRSGHFKNKCYAKTDICGNKIEYEEDSSEEEEEIVWQCNYCDRNFTTEFGCGVHEKSCQKKSVKTNSYSKNKLTCYNCGRQGHYSTDCYAKYHINGDYLG